LMVDDAVRLTPEGSKPSRLNSLSNSLAHRFERLGVLDDINKWRRAECLSSCGLAMR
jgi:hypothetical protein